MDQKNDTPQAPVEKPAEKGTQIDKELLSDLTIGLPRPARLLQESFILLKHKFLLFIGVLLLPFIFYLLTQILPTLIFFQANPLAMWSMNLVALFLNFFFFSLGYLALLFAIKDNEANISVLKAYSNSWHALLAFWKTLLLAFIIVAVSTLFFIVPGILLSVWFSVAIYVFVVEGLRSMDALLQSRGYVEGYWSAVLERIGYILIIITLLYLPLIIFWQPNPPILYHLVFVLTTLIALPVISIFGFLVYGNLRLLKGDTSKMAEALQSTKSVKVKLQLLKPILFQGALMGFPLVLIFIFFNVARPFVIQGDSMQPTYLHNGFLVINQLAFKNTQPLRGDIVVIRSPIEPDTFVIKRVLGLPGERILITNDHIFINDKLVDEGSYFEKIPITKSGAYLRDGQSLLLPKRHYFVMGDNRTASGDSREWGPIRESDILGKVAFCFWNCAVPEKK